MTDVNAEATDMTNAMQVFNNAEFGEIRTIQEGEEVFFCATDVARALGYTKPQDAVQRHCRYSVKRGVPHPQSPDKTIEMNFIPESDLYRLIVNSQMESAQRFEAWVFEEVLPSIRKHGAYMTPKVIEEALTNPDFIIRLAQRLKEEQARSAELTQKKKALEAQAEADKPKVVFADSVAASKTSILVGNLAKLLRQNGIDMGQNRLFRWLREKGYLMKSKGDGYNMPTQKSMERGLFEVKELTVNNPDGSIRITKTPKVTGQGQIFFINLFQNGAAALA